MFKSLSFGLLSLKRVVGLTGNTPMYKAFLAPSKKLAVNLTGKLLL